MSRIGKIPVPLPDGVTVAVQGDVVRVKGPKGELDRRLSGGVTARVDGNRLTLARQDDTAQSRALHGLYRALCAGMVQGVTKGFEERLEIVGVSYQAAMEKGRLRLQVGFSNPILVDVPKGLTVTAPSATLVVVQGIDKQLVGHFAATVRRIRPPEPYKGKGVRYSGERVIQKAGKSFVGGEK